MDSADPVYQGNRRSAVTENRPNAWPDPPLFVFRKPSIVERLLNRWRRLGLRLRLQILIQGSLIVILGAAQFWISMRFEQQVVHNAEVRARTVADGAINGLNTLMVTRVGSDDVISDKAARALFIKKMGDADKIREVRIMRSKAIDDEFAAGLPQEQPVDELDRRVLASGNAESNLIRGGAGEGALRIVLPFIASRNFRGTDCLKCHGVNEGAVIGAASVVIDVKDDLAAIARVKTLIWIGQGVLQILCGAALFFIARGVVRQLGGEPETAADLARQVAHGDLTARLDVRPQDTTSLMVRLKEMQTSLASVVSDVRRNAEELATASAQIAQGNLDLSGRTEEQASSLQETAASMEKLSAAVKTNTDHARQANELAQDASTVAVKGGEAVGRVVHTMRQINENSKKIADIIGVIDSIAFQTNILALNAAVEAARAGEQGRGFAVVATEVRTLARRSAEASKEINRLIAASVDRVAEGSELVDQAGATMQEIVSSIQRVTDIMSEISHASTEQSLGVRQVGEAIAQMDQTTQQNAALVEQSAAATQSLNDQAQQLVRAVAVFRLHPGEPAPAGA